MRKVLGLVLALLVVAPVAAYAQAEATIQGIVTDESKGVLPGVTVTATSSTTGRQYLAVTDERGEYRMPNVAPGTYRLQAELPGFATIVLPAVELLVGQNANVPFSMKVAGLEETVTVTSEAPLVDVSSSEVAGNVDRRQMEELPLAGRNWMELSMMVKGITANNVDQRPGVDRDNQFQLNLDGQQITQKVASSNFGQPKFSREAIAEFQIITNMFDITQGRSSGAQVQAISRSGTNTTAGSFYGYFRDDKFQSADWIAGQVLPYQNQQVGGTIGGPISRDKLLYFVSYEYEREPQTQLARNARIPSQTYSFDNTISQHSFLARVDHNLSARDNLSYRGSVWDFKSPFEIGSTSHPSNAAGRTRRSENVLASWARVIDANRVQELKIGYNHFDWANLLGYESLLETPDYVFPGVTFGGPRNFPQNPGQNMFTSRYDLTWHRGSHDMKIGGEFLYWKDSGFWHILRRGEFIFTQDLSEAEFLRRFPVGSEGDSSRWDVSGLDSIVQRFNQNTGDWTFDIPRPTWAVWIGDNWRVNDRLTLNYGVRWDDDLGATAPPDVGELNTTTFTVFNNEQLFQKSYDHNNVAPRAGFAWNVTGTNDFVIRGGTGLFYTTPVSNVTLSPQSFGTRMKVNTFLYDGRPGFVENPTRNFTQAQIEAGASPQLPRAIAHGYDMPYSWQSTIGFQKQLTPVMGFDADVTWLNDYNQERGRDPNLFFDPVTGYNLNPSTFGRPDPRWDEIQWIESSGKAEYGLLSTSFTRRFQNNFQGGVTYTYTFYRNDNTTGFGIGADNQFDLDDSQARSTDFQRHTLRTNWLFQLPYGISLATSYAFGSGTYYSTTISGRPFNKPGTNRLNIGNPITIPTSVVVSPANDRQIDVLSRYDGPAVVERNTTVPRNALQGLPLHKVDLRVSKTFTLVGNVKIQGIAEVFNLFDHENFGSYNAQVNSTTFGQPRQDLGNAYRPRTGQFAFKLSF
jgi:hypothetical protein